MGIIALKRTGKPVIRTAHLQDADRLLEIYAWYVRYTAVTFECTVPTAEEFRERMKKTMQGYPYLVLEQDGRILGYAYAGPFVGREAYARSTELTIYLDHLVQKQGLGRMLYGALEEELRKRGFLNLYACIGYPEKGDEYLTDNSAQFHAHLGFAQAGKFTNCGYKFGRWYHMIWMEKIIGDHKDTQTGAQEEHAAACEVLCIGQAVIDCITRGQEPDRHRENVFRAEKIELHIGGDAVNESVALSDLGHRAAIACGVGEDLAGNILRAELQRRGVDTTRIAVQKGLTTPIAQLVVHQDGGRHSINSRATMLEGYVPFAEAGEASPAGTGTCEDLQPPAQVMQAAMRGVRIVSLASLFRAPLDRPEVIRALVLAAKREGALVSADTKLPTFREVPVEALADVWPLIDFIFPNEKEAEYYTGETELSKMAEAFRRLGVRNVVIKAGAEGCYVDGEGIPDLGAAEAAHREDPTTDPAKDGMTLPDGRKSPDGQKRKEGGAFHLPALPVEVVDSTGAGDNFVAGFLSGVLRGEDLRACAERGRARASECISRMGAGRD